MGAKLVGTNSLRGETIIIQRGPIRDAGYLGGILTGCGVFR